MRKLWLRAPSHLQGAKSLKMSKGDFGNTSEIMPLGILVILVWKVLARRLDARGTRGVKWRPVLKRNGAPALKRRSAPAGWGHSFDRAERSQTSVTSSGVVRRFGGAAPTATVGHQPSAVWQTELQLEGR